MQRRQGNRDSVRLGVSYKHRVEVAGAQQALSGLDVESFRTVIKVLARVHYHGDEQ